MTILRSLVLGALSFAAAGCAIHPLPEDVTGYNSAQIVAKIRCETREALRGFLIELIRPAHPDIAAGMTNRTIRLRNFDRRRLSREIQRLLEKYDDAAIVYDFTFDITETNNLSAGADFLSTFTRGTVKTGLTAGSERARENTRQFRITDSFENLVSIVPEEYCAAGGEGKNWIYPITGSIGMVELLGTFFTLTESGSLTGGGKDKSDPVIADTIEFRTKFLGSVNPRVELSPLGRRFELVSAGFNADASREDTHKVIIAVSLPPEPQPAKTLMGRIMRTKSAKQRAQNAADEQISRKFINDRKKIDDKILRILQ